MAIALALVAAVAWGTSDFLGGLTARRTPGDMAFTVGLLTSAAGLAPIAALAFLGGGTFPVGSALLASLAGGAAGGIGISALYRGLERGRMGVVAPITGIIAAALPVAWGTVVNHESVSAGAWVGMALGVAAIGLVSWERDRPGDTSLAAAGIPEALVSGVGFAAFFVLLDSAGDGHGLWPLIPVKIGAIAVLVIVLVAARQPLLTPPDTWALIVAVGLLDLVANGAFLLATQRGLLSIVAVVSSMYPAGTVILARFVLHERLARHQLAGLPVAAVAVTLVALA